MPSPAADCESHEHSPAVDGEISAQYHQHQHSPQQAPDADPNSPSGSSAGASRGFRKYWNRLFNSGSPPHRHDSGAMLGHNASSSQSLGQSGNGHEGFYNHQHAQQQQMMSRREPQQQMHSGGAPSSPTSPSDSAGPQQNGYNAHNYYQSANLIQSQQLMQPQHQKVTQIFTEPAGLHGSLSGGGGSSVDGGRGVQAQAAAGSDQVFQLGGSSSGGRTNSAPQHPHAQQAGGGSNGFVASDVLMLGAGGQQHAEEEQRQHGSGGYNHGSGGRGALMPPQHAGMQNTGPAAAPRSNNFYDPHFASGSDPCLPSLGTNHSGSSPMGSGAGDKGDPRSAVVHVSSSYMQSHPRGRRIMQQAVGQPGGNADHNTRFVHNKSGGNLYAPHNGSLPVSAASAGGAPPHGNGGHHQQRANIPSSASAGDQWQQGHGGPSTAQAFPPSGGVNGNLPSAAELRHVRNNPPTHIPSEMFVPSVAGPVGGPEQQNVSGASLIPGTLFGASLPADQPLQHAQAAPASFASSGAAEFGAAGPASQQPGSSDGLGSFYRAFNKLGQQQGGGGPGSSAGLQSSPYRQGAPTHRGGQQAQHPASPTEGPDECPSACELGAHAVAPRKPSGFKTPGPGSGDGDVVMGDGGGSSEGFAATPASSALGAAQRSELQLGPKAHKSSSAASAQSYASNCSSLPRGGAGVMRFPQLGSRPGAAPGEDACKSALASQSGHDEATPAPRVRNTHVMHHDGPLLNTAWPVPEGAILSGDEEPATMLQPAVTPDHAARTGARAPNPLDRHLKSINAQADVSGLKERGGGGRSRAASPDLFANVVTPQKYRAPKGEKTLVDIPVASPRHNRILEEQRERLEGGGAPLLLRHKHDAFLAACAAKAAPAGADKGAVAVAGKHAGETPQEQAMHHQQRMPSWESDVSSHLNTTCFQPVSRTNDASVPFHHQHQAGEPLGRTESTFAPQPSAPQLGPGSAEQQLLLSQGPGSMTATTNSSSSMMTATVCGIATPRALCPHGVLHATTTGEPGGGKLPAHSAMVDALLRAPCPLLELDPSTGAQVLTKGALHDPLALMPERSEAYRAGAFAPAQQVESFSSDIGAFLRHLPFFSAISDVEVPRIAACVKTKEFGPGETVFRQGDPGDAFYFVLAGVASILVRDATVFQVGDRITLAKDVKFGDTTIAKGTPATIDKCDMSREYPYTIQADQSGQRGRVLAAELEPFSGLPPDKFVSFLRASDHFGEQSLLSGIFRGATIRAETRLRLGVLSREDFKKFSLRDRLVFAKRRFAPDSREDQSRDGGCKKEGAGASSAALGANGGGESSSGQSGSAADGGEKKRDRLAEEIAEQARDLLCGVRAKTAEEERFLVSSLLDNGHVRDVLLRTAAGAGDAAGAGVQVRLLTRLAQLREVRCGQVLIQQGDVDAGEMYVVDRGQFQSYVCRTNAAERVLRRGLDRHNSKGGAPPQPCLVSNDAERQLLGEKTFDYSVGGSFGELALLHHSARAASVICASEGGGRVWVLDKASVRRALMAKNDQKMALYLDYISKVEVFHSLLHDEKVQLADALVEKVYKRGDVVVEQGERARHFFVLCDGRVNFHRDGNLIRSVESNVVNASMGLAGGAGGNPQHGENGGGALSSLERRKLATCGNWFGERALLKRGGRSDCAGVVESEEATVLMVSKGFFDKHIGPQISDVLIEMEQRPERKSVNLDIPPERVRSMQRDQQIRGDELRRVGVLGAGGFGCVTLEQHKRTGQTYALKTLSKGYIVKSRMEKGVMREKQILSICYSPFIIRLCATFRSPNHLYFLMEPALGGELYATYHRRKFHGSFSKARFYSAGVIFAFEHLHERNVLYRDLKPENLLLDERGYLKLTDMGLAKVVASKTYTTCGTSEYFAPEVIQQTGSGKAVDWWTFGILIHELLSAHTPFEAGSNMETYRKIIKGVADVRFPYKDRDPEGWNLVCNLLRFNPADRLPMKPGGAANLKAHDWYDGFDFQTLEARTMTPPYEPNLRSNTDISNFKVPSGEAVRRENYVDIGTGWDADFGEERPSISTHRMATAKPKNKNENGNAGRDNNQGAAPRPAGGAGGSRENNYTEARAQNQNQGPGTAHPMTMAGGSNHNNGAPSGQNHHAQYQSAAADHHRNRDHQHGNGQNPNRDHQHANGQNPNRDHQHGNGQNPNQHGRGLNQQYLNSLNQQHNGFAGSYGTRLAGEMNAHQQQHHAGMHYNNNGRRFER